jgi:hypothetical protein
VIRIAITGWAGGSEAAAAQRRSGFGDVSSLLLQESTGSAVSRTLSLDHTRGRNTSTVMVPRRTSRRRSVRPRGHPLRPTRQPRAGLAAGRLGGQRGGVCDSCGVRALSAAQFASLGGAARCIGRRAWGARASAWGNRPLPIGHDDEPTPAAPARRARRLAGHHRSARVFARPWSQWTAGAMVAA